MRAATGRHAGPAADPLSPDAADATSTGGDGAVRWRRARRRGRLRGHRARQWVAALLAGAAAFVVVSALGVGRSTPTGVATVVALHGLPAGHLLTDGDVTVALRPGPERPESALGSTAEVVGRRLSVAVPARDVLSRERLLGASLLAGQPRGTVAMSVPVLDDGGGTARPGARVDVYAMGTGERVADGVVVLSVTDNPDAGGATGWSDGGSPTVVLGLDPVAASGVTRRLSAADPGQGFVLAVRAD
ncbi:MAG: SAF domain-containing protein [Terracoccus sp.]